MLLTSLLNFHGETWHSQEEIARNRREICSRPALVALSLSANILSIGLAFAQMFIDSTNGRLILSVVVLAVLLIALNCIVRADIARVTTTFTIMIAFILQVDGATFYFY